MQRNTAAIQCFKEKKLKNYIINQLNSKKIKSTKIIMKKNIKKKDNFGKKKTWGKLKLKLNSQPTQY